MKRLALPLVALLMACRETPTEPTSVAPELVTGCYQLSLGTWTAAHEAPDPPPVVLLLDSVGTFLLEAGRTLVRPSPVDTSPFGYMAWWARPVSDSLVVVFTTGYTGIRLALAWRDSQWGGRAEAFTDVQPSIEATTTAALTALGFVPACGLRAGAPTDRRMRSTARARPTARLADGGVRPPFTARTLPGTAPGRFGSPRPALDARRREAAVLVLLAPSRPQERRPASPWSSRRTGTAIPCPSTGGWKSKPPSPPGCEDRTGAS